MWRHSLRAGSGVFHFLEDDRSETGLGFNARVHSLHSGGVKALTREGGRVYVLRMTRARARVVVTSVCV